MRTPKRHLTAATEDVLKSPSLDALGNKTITFWGGLILNLNNVMGPAMVALPYLNQQVAGWLLCYAYCWRHTRSPVSCSFCSGWVVVLYPDDFCLLHSLRVFMHNDLWCCATYSWEPKLWWLWSVNRKEVFAGYRTHRSHFSVCVCVLLLKKKQKHWKLLQVWILWHH